MREYSRSDNALFNRMMAEVEPPDSIPAVSALAIGPENDLWVRRGGWLKTEPASIFDVFNGAGRYLGEIALPPRTNILEVGTNYLLTVRWNADDVPFVEMYGLDRRAPRSSPR